MMAISGGSRGEVDKLFANAIELGAKGQDKPGERMPLFCGAFVRNLDGKKLCFYEMNPA